MSILHYNVKTNHNEGFVILHKCCKIVVVKIYKQVNINNASNSKECRNKQNKIQDAMAKQIVLKIIL